MTIAWRIAPTFTRYRSPVRVFVQFGEVGVAEQEKSRPSLLKGSREPGKTEIVQRLELERSPARISDSRLQNSVDRAIAFMQDNLDRPISLEDIARAAAFSKYHFARCFKAMTGYPPHAYLTLMRIECASRLISSSDMPIADIAASSGFASASSLSHVFRRKLGFTPTQLRGRNIVFVPSLLSGR